MEKKTDGIVLASKDYKENDRLLTVLTAEEGKLFAVARGVKKANAKLRFAAQPLCFAEFVFAEKAGRHTLISASCHESFYALWGEKLYPASAVLEIANLLSPEGEGKELFLDTVKALRNMAAGDERAALVSYLLRALALGGFPLEAGRCSVCGRELFPPKTYFQFPTGNFSCGACRKGVGTAYATYCALRDPQSADADALRRALRLLKEYISYKTELEPSCLGAYLKQLSEAGQGDR